MTDLTSRFATADQLKAARESGEELEKQAPTDNRRLWQVLQEQKQQKEQEAADRRRHLGPRALDEDDVAFLEAREAERVARLRTASEAAREDIEEFREQVDNNVITIEDKERSALAAIKASAKLKQRMAAAGVGPSSGAPGASHKRHFPVVTAAVKPVERSTKKAKSSEQANPMSLLATYADDSEESEDNNDG